MRFFDTQSVLASALAVSSSACGPDPCLEQHFEIQPRDMLEKLDHVTLVRDLSVDPNHSGDVALIRVSTDATSLCTGCSPCRVPTGMRFSFDGWQIRIPVEVVLSEPAGVSFAVEGASMTHVDGRQQRADLAAEYDVIGENAIVRLATPEGEEEWYATYNSDFGHPRWQD